MSSNKIELLGLFYAVLFIIYVLLEIIFIKKHNKIKVISCVRFIYALIYGFVPVIIYLICNLTNIDYSDTGINDLYVLLLLSVIGYMSLNFGYIINFSKKRHKFGISSIEKSTRKITTQGEVHNIYLSGIVIMTIAFIALLLWTKAFGSPFGIIPYAGAIRSGYSPKFNSLAFMKHPSSLIMFSSYIFFIFLNDRKYNRLATFALFSFSVFWSYVYLMSNDGRMTFIMYFAIFILYKIFNSNKLKKKAIDTIFIMKVAIIAVCAFMLMSSADYFLQYLRYGTINMKVSSNNRIPDRISKELGYTIRSGQTALKALDDGTAGNKILMDLQAGLFAYIPSRFKPADIMSLPRYNTMLINNISPGTIPTDLISMSIYDLGILGVMVIPLILGLIIKRMDKCFEVHSNSKYYSMLYILSSVFISIRTIAYADLENLLISFFFIIFGHLIVKILSQLII